MKIYLVGGAVRDQLLNIPYHEQDWVVVGSSPDELLQRGYTPVGKDFPVFLHPQTKEEFALARTERKTGPGYGGFSFHCDPSITLEDDLARRDLTINAIAQDENGQLIDPYGGKQDIEHKILRHVSEAFSEDPVRILRTARFSARFHSLGFNIASETQSLMQKMVVNGEVDHLVSERIWKEMSRALTEKNPEIFFNTLRSCGALARILPELDRLFGVPQPEEHHPEIDTGEHSLLVLKKACKLSTSPQIRFAALVHDLGKGETPKELWPKHHGHEQRGLMLVNQLCERITAPKDFRELALLTTEFHTHCHRAFELKSSTILKLLKKADAFRRPARFADFLLCCKADSCGRKNFEARHYPQADYLHRAYLACNNVNVQSIVAQGFKHAEIGTELDLQRLNALKQLKKKEPLCQSHP